MPLDEWRALFELSDRHGFVIACDECYSEIYFRDEAPLGSLQAATALGRDDFRNLVALHQPVQALQRAGPALRLRGRRRRHPEGLPALPHLPRQRDEPAGAARQHRGLGRRGPRGRSTATCTAPSSPRSRRCWPTCWTCACPTPASTCGRRCLAGDDVDFADALAGSIQCDRPARQPAGARGPRAQPWRRPHPHGPGAPRRRMRRSGAAHPWPLPSPIASAHDTQTSGSDRTGLGRPRPDHRRLGPRSTRGRRARDRRPERRPPARRRAPGRRPVDREPVGQEGGAAELPPERTTSSCTPASWASSTRCRPSSRTWTTRPCAPPACAWCRRRWRGAAATSRRTWC